MPLLADYQAAAAELLPTLFEQHAFIFCDPLDPESAAATAESQIDNAVVATVEFGNGACSGRCQLGAPLPLCREIAANVLGTDADDPMAIAAAPDAFKEVANIVTAHLLTALFGQDVQLDIAAPDVSELMPAQWREGLMAPNVSCFDAESYPVWLDFTCNETSFPGKPPTGGQDG